MRRRNVGQFDWHEYAAWRLKKRAIYGMLGLWSASIVMLGIAEGLMRVGLLWRIQDACKHDTAACYY